LGAIYQCVCIYISILYFSKIASVLCCPVLSAIGGQTARPIELKIGTNLASRANMRTAPHIQHRRPNDRAYRAPNWNKHSFGQWVELMGVSDFECALMRAAGANMRAALHIQHMRPNGWADTHSLVQWAVVMGVGGRECVLMRALRAQTCAQHHTYRIGAQRAGPIEPQISTKTHCGNGHKLWGRRVRSARSAQSGRRS
jgi:hypothetical protein